MLGGGLMQTTVANELGTSIPQPTNKTESGQPPTSTVTETKHLAVKPTNMSKTESAGVSIPSEEGVSAEQINNPSETELQQLYVSEELVNSHEHSTNRSEIELQQLYVSEELVNSHELSTNRSEIGLNLVSKLTGREYHLVLDMMSWVEARAHCQRSFTDLASIPSPEEEEMIEVFAARGTWLWIGLHNDDQSPDGWRWTTGESFNYTNWAPWYTPEFNATVPICVYIDIDQWMDTHCDIPLPFVCYTEPSPKLIDPDTNVIPGTAANHSETGNSQMAYRKLCDHPLGRDFPPTSGIFPSFSLANDDIFFLPCFLGSLQAKASLGRGYHLIKELKTWSEARDYCQNRFTDLANILSWEEWEVVTRFAIPSVWLWIGLYNDDHSSNGWKWTTGEKFRYTSWVPWHPQELNVTFPSCVYIDQEQWVDTQCDVLLPFICYTELPAPSSAEEPEAWNSQTTFILDSDEDLDAFLTNLSSTGELPVLSITDEEAALIGQFGNMVGSEKILSQSLHHKSKSPYMEGRPLTQEGGDREYSVVRQEKTWKDARDHCRRNYTDLVSFRTPREEALVSSMLGQGEWKWIGLHNEELKNSGWKWVNGDNFTYSNWALWYQEQFSATSHVCVSTDREEWFGLQCDFALSFICYAEVQQARTPEANSYPAELGDKQRKPPAQALYPKQSGHVQSIGTEERLYFLIEQRNNWTEAREYCQRHYTGLLSIRSKEETEILSPLLAQVKWIGLFTGQLGTWSWSNGDVYQYANWSPTYPFKYTTGVPMCTYASNKGWAEETCDTLFPFICYLDMPRPRRLLPGDNMLPPTGERKDITLRDTISGRNFRPNRNQTISSGDRMYYLIEEEKTWNKAWTYCRNHYTNLVSVRSAEEASIVAMLVHGPQWIGLYTDGMSGWMWTNGDRFGYAKWGLWHPYNFNNSLPMCVAIFDAEWHEADCDFPFPFICYRDVRSNGRTPAIANGNIGLPVRSEQSYISKDYSDILTDFTVDSTPRRLYHKVTAEKTWSDARDYCRAQFTDLLSIQSEQESNDTRALFEELKQSWVGLYNERQMAETWEWADHSRVNYTSWKAGQPHRYSLLSPVCVYVEEGLWTDAPCRFLLPFICYSGNGPEAWVWGLRAWKGSGLPNRVSHSFTRSQVIGVELGHSAHRVHSTIQSWLISD
ncbi:C-type mannose receptor 2-like [Leucoraja erinacea]|uniref:C-type mannose receptor 2-like n=1 Tax=Leucoraja erinaceus TaxID=7782 RepID=UPI00245886CF|nr:C-type mannose receptor 2-like [Leucoraja erinacea]